MEKEVIKGFKGFDKDLKCRDFQYEIGKEFKHVGIVSPCNSGFHFCQNPLDVFGYYAPGISRYGEVEGSGECKDHPDDSKIACSRLRVKAEISLKSMVDLGVKFILENVNFKNAKATNTGDRSAATNTGDQSAATNTGNQSAATNTGNQSAATNTGYRSAATNTGYQSAATNTGNQSAATNTGNQSAATNTGYQSAAKVEGNESIAIVTGYEGKAAGKKGCWIVLTERDCNGHILKVAAKKVDGERIKEDTFYTLKNRKVIEA